MRRFHLVRVIDIRSIDIANLQFDFDLVFAVLFLNGHGHVYSRYGGRTPWNAESRVSLEGLQYTMREVLRVHRPGQHPSSPPSPALLARDLPGAGRSCMHCHEVWEGLRRKAKAEGTFNSRSLFVYPRPENVGMRLDVTQGNVVLGVKAKTPAGRAGLLRGVRILRLGTTPIHSQADVSWALHNAPDRGELAIEFTRDGVSQEATLNLPLGWKETKLSWRASMRGEEDPSSP